MAKNLNNHMIFNHFNGSGTVFSKENKESSWQADNYPYDDS
jgi:hypothetical protein